MKMFKPSLLIIIIAGLLIFSGCNTLEGTEDKADLITTPSTTPAIKENIINDESITPEELSMETYENFLNNEARVSFERYMPRDYIQSDLFQYNTEYTLSEVLNVITNFYFNDKPDKQIKFMDYSYVDCGKDGDMELALRFYGLNLYSEDDDSTLVYIIKHIDGKLFLCYYYETWARSESIINEYGYYESGGSGGASNYVSEYGLVDKDGIWQFIVSIENEQDINQFAWQEDGLGQLPKVAKAKGITSGIQVDTVCFDDYVPDGAKNNFFYTFYVYDDNWNLIEDDNLYTDSIYKDIFDEAMIPFITPDEVEVLIEEKKAQVGATAEIIAGAEVIWNTLYFNN